MGREVRPVAEMTAAAHHREIHAGAAALHLHRENVGVFRRHSGVVLDRLLMQHARQGAELIANVGGLLEVQRLGVRHHFRLQRVHHLLLLAEQKPLGVADVARIVFARDVVDARSGAALDLVQQTRPRAVVEHRVFAGAQLEDFLQQLDRFLDCPRARERTEVAVLLVH